MTLTTSSYAGIRPITVDQAVVFYGLAKVPGVVFHVPASGPAQLPAPTGTGGTYSAVNDLAVDQTYVYFTTQRVSPYDGVVMRAPRTSGTAELVWKSAGANPNPTGIAVDDKAIYWVEYDDGMVYKLAK